MNVNEATPSTNLGEAQCSSPPRRLFTLGNFAVRHSGFTTLSGLTNQVFNAQPRHSTKGEIRGNGMLDYGVIVRSGRRVLIDEDAYFRWLDAQQGGE